ncbi:sugar dehydrogenase complex small subunit [Pseudoxanthomonas sp.]|uniref:sugar dehydrogenase complex small subunit n=1 Tax=Pseudoxanthomonas sp. TaxID=1871049 RepID=UPI002623B66C|nr:sugar dehydrogenase complex small subunit [Pseudoxanthomonas sp.]WDS34960.1 MAG: sugar dehydrogenase complex small subunit [Pseudoxanthomonas sp.]
MTHPSIPPEQHPGTLPRRKFLVTALWGIGAVSVATSATWSWAQAVSATDTPRAPASFIAVSRLLTGHTIDASLADRGWAAISARETDFAQRFSQLEAAITRAGLTDMQGWSGSAIAADPALKATALAIVSAWYLGVVGQVKDRAEDGPAFITYEGALMWRPTLDVTVIPTYARGRPGFWKDKPASVATD